MLMEQKLKPIGPFVVGQIVEYVQREQERLREQLGRRRWHVVQVDPQQETAVEQGLEDQGIAAYLPRVPHKIRVNAYKHRSAWRPMFVSYLFAGFDPAGELWWDIRGVRGVRRLFMIDFKPVPIPDEVMARIRQKEQELAGGRSVNMPIHLKPGSLVRILAPFAWAGLFANVVAVDQVKRVISVEVNLFGRMTPMPLMPDQVEVV